MPSQWGLFTDVCEDPALRAFGGGLALVNVLTAVFWLTVQPIALVLSDRADLLALLPDVQVFPNA